MVYQGTVLGPWLWNIFYEDVKAACAAAGFTETVFADDLNSYQLVPSICVNEALLKDAGHCQAEVHSWGRANGVSFEATKESKHILSKGDPHGKDF